MITWLWTHTHRYSLLPAETNNIEMMFQNLLSFIDRNGHRVLNLIFAVS